MPSIRQTFEPGGSPGSRTVRTLVGLVVILALLAAGGAWLLLGDSPAMSSAIVPTAPSVLYLSATDGALYSSEEDGGARVVPGDTLVQGRIYETADASSTLIRSGVHEISLMLGGDTAIAPDSSLDGSIATIVTGRAHVQMQTEGEPLRLGLGGIALDLQPPVDADVWRSSDAAGLRVFEGSVRVRFGDEEHLIAAGEVLTLDADGAEVSTPGYLAYPLLESPATGTLYRRTEGGTLPLELQWSVVDGAEWYLVELAGDVLFSQVLSSRRSEDSRLSVPDVQEGSYYWRVTAHNSSTRSAASPSGGFTVAGSRGQEDETVAIPGLAIESVTAQSNLVSVSGQTEPGASIQVYLESNGIALTARQDVTVSPTGAFRAQVEAPERGELTVVVLAFYRPEHYSSDSATVFVDF